jgi:hypothetical protein
MPRTAKIELQHRMGRSPVIGYWLYDQGDSIELDAYRAKGYMRKSVRLPKNPDDMLRLVTALLEHTHGELSRASHSRVD